MHHVLLCPSCPLLVEAFIVQMHAQTSQHNQGQTKVKGQTNCIQIALDEVRIRPIIVLIGVNVFFSSVADISAKILHDEYHCEVFLTAVELMKP